MVTSLNIALCPLLWLETAEPVTQPYTTSSMHTDRQAEVLRPHTHVHCTGYDAFATPTHKRLKNRSALWCHCLEVWCQKPCIVTLSNDMVYERTAGGVKVRNNCATCIINGWNTYLTCSADLWKHTSGCRANKSRLYCPLTSAELLIVIVTQLQRRACTVDWGSPSLTSWLTAANAPLI